MQGKLIIFSAPSGSGKTTIVQELLKQDIPLEFSISATSREARAHEIHGKDYYFLSPEEFKNRIEKNELLEWEEVYKDQFYGTLKSEVERITSKGSHVIFDIDVVGGLNLKRMFQDRALAIFIQAPSVEELENRLKNRGTENQESLQKRLDKASYEMTFAKDFDLIVVNDNLESAIENCYKSIKEFVSHD